MVLFLYGDQRQQPELGYDDQEEEHPHITT